jgi:hypothetical protein
LIITLFAVLSCNKNNSYTPPPCISAQIEAFKTNTCEHGASVNEYNFQNRSVFAFTMGNCGGDMSTPVFDSECNILGYLGGISGNTKINGVEFSTAVYIRTLWSK